jgi:hypothetical protein
MPELLRYLISFYPEMAYSANPANFIGMFLNQRDRLCDVARHVSARSLDFLDLDEIYSFLNWKHQQVSIRQSLIPWTDTNNK